MKIRNWSKFQHFKDRKPPWIKLYRDLLDDMDWHTLDSDAAKLLVMLWLIASENDGHIPDAKTLAFRCRLPESKIKQSLTHLSQWLDHDDINVISERYHDDCIETETEKEIKTETKSNRGSRLPVDFVLPEEWIQFCKTERKDLNPDKVFAEFKDYWTALPAGKGTKADWTATWRNWVRRQSAPKQTFAQQAADIARMTVPSTAPDRDPVLIQLEQDFKKATPMPANIREMMQGVVKRI
jgi:hypothetical protein